MDEATPKPPAVSLSPNEAIVVFYMDLACHILNGMIAQLQLARSPNPASYLAQVSSDINGWRDRYIRRCQTGIMLATPADMPKELS